MVCSKSFMSNVSCPNGHFVCDTCHSLTANEMILTHCHASNETNPLTLASNLMKHKSIKMHGPEHHFLVPAVLLTCYYNSKGEPKKKEPKLKVAIERSKTVPGGYCGTHGTCGAGIGSGIFISIITGSTPLAKEEWKLSNMMTSLSLHQIALHGGPRCCKRDTFLAIEEANSFLQKEFDFSFQKLEPFFCNFSKHNRQCIGEQCKYFA